MGNYNTDQDAIRLALEHYYFGGIYEGDIKLLKKIFHPGALLFGDVKGRAYSKTLDQYLEGVANREAPKSAGKPFEKEVASIKVINSIAIAEVRMKMYDFFYYDLLSFHRIEGNWLIVNKMLTDLNH